MDNFNNNSDTQQQQQQEQSLIEYIASSLKQTIRGSHIYTIFVLSSKPILTTKNNNKNKSKKQSAATAKTKNKATTTTNNDNDGDDKNKITTSQFHKKLLIL